MSKNNQTVVVPHIEDNIPLPQNAKEALPEMSVNEEIKARTNTIKLLSDITDEVIEPTTEDIEKAVREEFPNKFRNPNKDTAPAVESSGNKGTKSGKGFSEADLDDRERKVMNSLVRQKIMTKEEYLADLKKIKGA